MIKQSHDEDYEYRNEIKMTQNHGEGYEYQNRRENKVRQYHGYGEGYEYQNREGYEYRNGKSYQYSHEEGYEYHNRSDNKVMQSHSKTKSSGEIKNQKRTKEDDTTFSADGLNMANPSKKRQPGGDDDI